MRDQCLTNQSRLLNGVRPFDSVLLIRLLILIKDLQPVTISLTLFSYREHLLRVITKFIDNK